MEVSMGYGIAQILHGTHSALCSFQFYVLLHEERPVATHGKGRCAGTCSGKAPLKGGLHEEEAFKSAKELFIGFIHRVVGGKVVIFGGLAFP